MATQLQTAIKSFDRTIATTTKDKAQRRREARRRRYAQRAANAAASIMRQSLAEKSRKQVDHDGIRLSPHDETLYSRCKRTARWTCEHWESTQFADDVAHDAMLDVCSGKEGKSVKYAVMTAVHRYRDQDGRRVKGLNVSHDSKPADNAGRGEQEAYAARKLRNRERNSGAKSATEEIFAFAQQVQTAEEDIEFASDAVNFMLRHGTARQYTIIQHMLSGLSTTQTAEALEVNVRTVQRELNALRQIVCRMAD